MKLFDLVTLLLDMPVEGLRRGATGAIVDLHGDPVEAYEVEFVDERGRTIAQLALRPEQITLLRQNGAESDQGAQ